MIHLDRPGYNHRVYSRSERRDATKADIEHIKISDSVYSGCGASRDAKNDMWQKKYVKK